MTTKICRLKGIKFSMCSLAIEWVDMIGNGDKDLAKQKCSLISNNEHYSRIYKNSISPGSSLANL